MWKKIAIGVGILVLLSVGCVALLNNSDYAKSTEPIYTEAKNHPDETWSVGDHEVTGDTAFAIVSITDKTGEKHFEKYFLSKVNDVWTIEKHEPYTPPPAGTGVGNGLVQEVTLVSIVNGERAPTPQDAAGVYLLEPGVDHHVIIQLKQIYTEPVWVTFNHKILEGGFGTGTQTVQVKPTDPPTDIIWNRFEALEIGGSKAQLTIKIGDSSGTVTFINP